MRVQHRLQLGHDRLRVARASAEKIEELSPDHPSDVLVPEEA